MAFIPCLFHECKSTKNILDLIAIWVFDESMFYKALNKIGKLSCKAAPA